MTLKIWNWITEKAQKEDGEVSSWLICAAGLCGAAAATAGPLQGKFESLVEAIPGG